MNTRYSLIFLILLFAVPPAPAFSADSKVPREVGGFVLGSKISDYPDVVHSNFLKEIVVTDHLGFRKGIVSYGVCKYAGQILKIELKYADSSKKYFQKLLDEFKKSYGPPAEWKGDSFGILHVWKWYFVDQDKKAVSLLLQHNLQDPNESVGNMVKLSYPDLIQEEQECFNQMCDEAKVKHGKNLREQKHQADWDYLIPR
jgi:hypothetical protein